MRLRLLYVLAALTFSYPAFAFQIEEFRQQIRDEIQSDETYKYPDYYQVKEDPRLQNINLLVFQHFAEPLPFPEAPYNRKAQFGTWIKDRTDGTCLDTRGKILVRDSKSNVSYRPSGCAIDAGDWDDPYSGKHFKSASDIQIDHFVPLKNTYMTGGYEWDQAKRCLYANYMGNNFHLLSVSAKENQRKSDSTPSKYMPSDRAYACQYLKQWLEVKTIWTLRITPKEFLAIRAKVEQSHCDPAEFVISNRFIQDQRRFMEDNADLCTK